MNGTQPYWPNSIFRVIKPAAKKIGLTKRIGWYTFRHTFGTILNANGENPKVIQDCCVMQTSKSLWTLTFKQLVMRMFSNLEILNISDIVCRVSSEFAALLFAGHPDRCGNDRGRSSQKHRGDGRRREIVGTSSLRSGESADGQNQRRRRLDQRLRRGQQPYLPMHRLNTSENHRRNFKQSYRRYVEFKRLMSFATSDRSLFS